MRSIWPLATLLITACYDPTPPPTRRRDAGVQDSGTSTPPDSGTPAPQVVELLITPSTIHAAPGDVVSISVLAHDETGATLDFTDRVNWSVDLPSVAEVQTGGEPGTAQVVALAEGVANVVATFEGLRSPPCSVTVAAPAPDAGPGGDGGVTQDGGTGNDGGVTQDGGTSGPGEVRALWVTRFAYSDATGVRNIIRQAAASGFNVVFFQIRGNGDAYYRSSLVPWAARLSGGVLGHDPLWDPLQEAITEAHLLGIQLHAYFNAFTAWPTPSGCSGDSCKCSVTPNASPQCTLPPASEGTAPTHYLRAHPEALAVDTNGYAEDTEYYWFSPADPDYRKHLLAVVEELLTNYDVDGLHLDRIRYPGTWASYDPASQSAWAALPFPKPARADWQRAQVSDTVGAIYDVVKRVKPRAVLSASVWGIYTPLTNCNTSQGYANYFQDSIGWVQTGRIDWLVPMIYWDLYTGCTAFDQHLNNFVANGRGPRIVAGMEATDDLADGGTDIVPSRVSARIQYSRSVGATGVSVYSSSSFGAGDWGFFRADGGVFATDAGVPAPTWR